MPDYLSDPEIRGVVFEALRVRKIEKLRERSGTYGAFIQLMEAVDADEAHEQIDLRAGDPGLYRRGVFLMEQGRTYVPTTIVGAKFDNIGTVPVRYHRKFMGIGAHEILNPGDSIQFFGDKGEIDRIYTPFYDEDELALIRMTAAIRNAETFDSIFGP